MFLCVTSRDEDRQYTYVLIYAQLVTHDRTLDSYVSLALQLLLMFEMILN